MLKYPEAFSRTDEYFAEEKYRWTEKVKKSSLARVIEGLDTAELEILTLHVMEGYSLTEIAHMKGVTPAAVSKTFVKIRNKFLKECNN